MTVKQLPIHSNFTHHIHTTHTHHTLVLMPPFMIPTLARMICSAQTYHNIWPITFVHYILHYDTHTMDKHSVTFETAQQSHPASDCFVGQTPEHAENNQRQQLNSQLSRDNLPAPCDIGLTLTSQIDSRHELENSRTAVMFTSRSVATAAPTKHNWTVKTEDRSYSISSQ